MDGVVTTYVGGFNAINMQVETWGHATSYMPYE